MTLTYTSPGILGRLLWPFRDASGRFGPGWLAAADIVVWAAWSGSLQMFTLMPPAAGFAWVLLVGSTFLWRYSLSDARAGSRRHLAPAIGFGGAPPGAVLPAALAIATFGQLWGLVYRRIPEMSAPPPVRWDGYADTSVGLAATLLMLLIVGPVMEEFCFRGWIMPTLTGRYGALAGITGSSLLFGLLHAELRWSAYFIVPGLLLGVAVHLTGSVWTGVALHAAYNGLGAVVKPFFPTAEALEGAVEGLGAGQWSAPIGLVAALGVLAWSAHRLVPGGGSSNRAP